VLVQDDILYLHWTVFPNQCILKLLIKVYQECSTESVARSKPQFPSLGG